MENSEKGLPKQSEIKIKNVAQTMMTVHLEPWGEQHKLDEQNSIIIEAFSKFQGYFELEFEGDNVFVYGWAGSSCRVKYDDGRPMNPTVPISS